MFVRVRFVSFFMNLNDFSECTVVGKSAMCNGKSNETLQMERNGGGSRVKEKCRNVIVAYNFVHI